MALVDPSGSRDPLRSRSAGQPRRRLDRWVSAGRQLVDGVAGTRPGSGNGRAGIDGVGRWMGERLDWLLEEGDDWREPWQERPSQERRPTQPPAPERRPDASSRRVLDAVSRRGAAVATSAPPGHDDWPDEESFTIPRWQRRDEPAPDTRDQSPPAPAARPVPRSSRRRQL